MRRLRLDGIFIEDGEAKEVISIDRIEDEIIFNVKNDRGVKEKAVIEL